MLGGCGQSNTPEVQQDAVIRAEQCLEEGNPAERPRVKPCFGAAMLQAGRPIGLQGWGSSEAG